MSSQAIVDKFHDLFYRSEVSYRATKWLGVSITKCPMDLWIYQEIFFETRPDLVIETGTWFGGSALYIASLFDLLGNGVIHSVDIAPMGGRPVHPRITYHLASSADANGEAVKVARTAVADGKKVMVILDSDHVKSHVIKELALWPQFVTVGQYLIVEDTNMNGHPAMWSGGPGPMEALWEWNPGSHGFEVDRSREKFFLTFNPSGYLKKVR